MAKRIKAQTVSTASNLRNLPLHKTTAINSQIAVAGLSSRSNPIIIQKVAIQLDWHPTLHKTIQGVVIPYGVHVLFKGCHFVETGIFQALERSSVKFEDCTNDGSFSFENSINTRIEFSGRIETGTSVLSVTRCEDIEFGVTGKHHGAAQFLPLKNPKLPWFGNKHFNIHFWESKNCKISVREIQQRVVFQSKNTTFSDIVIGNCDLSCLELNNTTSERLTVKKCKFETLRVYNFNTSNIDFDLENILSLEYFKSPLRGLGKGSLKNLAQCLKSTGQFSKYVDLFCREKSLEFREKSKKWDRYAMREAGLLEFVFLVPPVSVFLSVFNWGANIFFKRGHSMKAPIFTGAFAVFAFSPVFYFFREQTEQMSPRITNYVEALYYSFITFASVGMASNHPLIGVKFVATFEGILGVLMFGLFLNAVSKKI